MRRSILGAALFAAALAAGAVPASAQDRARRTADRISDQIRDAADAVGTVRDAFDDSVRDLRFQGADRDAVARCAPSVERYGRMRVEDVRRYGRRSLRVYGTIEGRYGHGLRSFTCTVRDDGRVRLKTSRYYRR
jgi:acyl-CoA synthetase (AMP-forming)/AMP-acid ligase II